VTGRSGLRPGGATARPSSSPPAELAGDTGARVPVWIAVGRAGVTAHKIAPPVGDKRRTVCGRFVGSAEREQGQVHASSVVAERYRATWCRHCWPPPQTETEARR
jgi:hypothetical protein